MLWNWSVVSLRLISIVEGVRHPNDKLYAKRLLQGSVLVQGIAGQLWEIAGQLWAIKPRVVASQASSWLSGRPAIRPLSLQDCLAKGMLMVLMFGYICCQIMIMRFMVHDGSCIIILFSLHASKFCCVGRCSIAISWFKLQ